MTAEYKDITNLEWIRLTQADFDLIRDTAQGTFVEVGTFHGASAYAASQNADHIWTIDIYEWTPLVYEILPTNCQITFFKETSDDFIKQFKGPIDILFIDGSHEYDYIKRDIAALCPLVRSGGQILFHDYHDQSTGVKPAVDEYLEKEKPTDIIYPIPNICKILKVQKP